MVEIILESRRRRRPFSMGNFDRLPLPNLTTFANVPLRNGRKVAYFAHLLSSLSDRREYRDKLAICDTNENRSHSLLYLQMDHYTGKTLAYPLRIFIIFSER